MSLNMVVYDDASVAAFYPRAMDKKLICPAVGKRPRRINRTDGLRVIPHIQLDAFMEIGVILSVDASVVTRRQRPASLPVMPVAIVDLSGGGKMTQQRSGLGV
jgi:hypothetical protein